MVAMMSWAIKVQEQGWRKGPWTPEEDKLLSEYVTLHGEGRWSSVARCAGLNRSGKSCRLRWVNYLRPGLKRGQITPQEEGIIIELHALWGNKWSTIARYLPERTDNEIKNFWRTHFKKKDKSSNNQKHLIQKRRSFQVLKEKLQRETLQAQSNELDYSKTTTTATLLEPKTTMCTDQNTTCLITNTTVDGQTNHVMHQDESTALFPWSDAVADHEFGWAGFLWNLDDTNYYGCARTDKLAPQIITNNYYGSGDINFPKVNNNSYNMVTSNAQNNGGYIF